MTISYFGPNGEPIKTGDTHLFGDYLKRERKARDLTLRALAEKSGTSSAYLSQLETGARPQPKPTMLKKIVTGLSNDPTEQMKLYDALSRSAGFGFSDDNSLLVRLQKLADDQPALMEQFTKLLKNTSSNQIEALQLIIKAAANKDLSQTETIEAFKALSLLLYREQ